MGTNQQPVFKTIKRRLLSLMKRRLFGVVISSLVAVWLLISFLVFLVERTVTGANITSLQDGVWWGLVTFMTVGYGDRYPITAHGRVMAGILMLAGVCVIGIITAKLSSYFLEQALSQRRGLVDTDSLNDHVVVCGWKEEMHVMLAHILDFNPGLTASKIVMLANIKPEVVDDLREQPLMNGLNVVIGDYYNESTLRKAAPARARKVLILADRSPGPSGQPATMSEVDARTVMTAMTLSHIARGASVAAEILDPKMDQYLRLAGVSEIIYSREYSRLLIGNASGGTGVTNIIFDLLDPNTPTVITTQNIPNMMISLHYPEFKQQYELDHPKTVVIGILENTGNSHRAKELALRQAQKTADIQKLVKNLQTVKNMKFNHPVFTPSSDYVIKEGSLAIVIESRQGRQHKEGYAHAQL